MLVHTSVYKFNSVVSGHHIYKTVWASLSDEMLCTCGVGSEHNTLITHATVTTYSYKFLFMHVLLLLSNCNQYTDECHVLSYLLAASTQSGTLAGILLIFLMWVGWEGNSKLKTKQKVLNLLRAH